ncbi:MFT2-Corn MFT-like protein [Gonapodya sp. JEL0774]|nr:MFT2-Corn MFT-like protein [Gonapodya sp. JEL0774]
MERQRVNERIEILRARIGSLRSAVESASSAEERATLANELDELIQAKRLAEIDLEWSKLANHANYPFVTGVAVDPSSQISIAMKHDHFIKHNCLSLLAAASRFEVLTDIFGAVSAPIAQHHKRRHQLTQSPSRFFQPEVEVEVAFRVPKPMPSSKDSAVPKRRPLRIGEKVAFGSVTLESPEVSITTNDERTRYFTLMMLDLDRPNVETSSYEEWCHWLVVDIPVTSYLILPPLPVASVPSAPPSSFPGITVLPYIPPHPPKQNPSKIHRYVLLAIEQPTSKLDVSTAFLTAVAESARSTAATSNLPITRRTVEGPAELAWQIRERAAVAPLVRFLKGDGPAKTSTGVEMVVKGMALWGADWDAGLGAVYEFLGLHEPVFANLPRDPTAFLRRFQNRQALLQGSQLPTPESATPLFSDALLARRMEAAREKRMPPKIVTKGELAVRKLKESEASGQTQKQDSISKKNPKPAKVESPKKASKAAISKGKVERRVPASRAKPPLGARPIGRGRFGVTAAAVLVNFRKAKELRKRVA